MEPADVQIPALRSLGSGKAAAVIALASACVVGFLFWLIYFNRGTGYTSAAIAALPALNAGLNALSAVLLIAGYIAVKRRKFATHIQLMFTALGSSTLFFISYVIYHKFHGDTKFLSTGPIRPVYFFILISHIVLSVVVVPMILTTLYLSLSGRLTLHKRVARFTFPIWLYVSVTGVLIFVLLKLCNTPPAS